YRMLESPQDESVVRWGNEGDSFVVLENEKFTKHILPKHFKHSNFASFVRQLNKYDFHKVRHSNEENGQSPYGAGAWEFKHPDFKMNNKEALDNIRRKAPAPRKPNTNPEDLVIPTQQMDMFNTQLVATQQQLQQLQERYNELSIHHSMLLQELVGMQKTIVNHEHIMQSVMQYLQNVDAQRRRDSRLVNPNPFPDGGSGAHNGNMDPANQQVPGMDDDAPASPLQHASKLLSETNADVMLNPRNLEHMNELAMRMNGTLTTPPPDFSRNGTRPASRGAAPHSASSSTSMRIGDIDNLVYPVGQNNGIDPMYSEHIHNIPYPLPSKPVESTDPRYRAPEQRKKSAQVDPGWIRQPQILLVEDDQTCRRIGSKFLYAFNCAIDSALDGLEAVNKMNSGSKYDLVLMDIIMPNLDGVSACHLIRQFDSTPIIAMTSNIRSDDISMYFQHGMNDVLPKPFTKEGLLLMLEKHLAHLKKPSAGMDAMVPPAVQAPTAMQHSSGRPSLKDEDSPSKSPTTGSNWNSPSQMPGVSPVGSSVTEEYMNTVHGHHPTAFGVPTQMPAGIQYNTSPQMPMGARQQGGQQHRRQISEITGGDELNNPNKRQQIEKPRSGDDTVEEPFQAVVLADSYEPKFYPLTLEKPRCLLTLANTPLIEYTFEFLANAGVEEVFVYCGAHTDLLEEYIQNSKWYAPSSPFSKVELIRSTSHTVGDAMRDLDHRGFLVGDFLVLYGDVVSNLSLKDALAAHKARREKDKNAIMTMVLREAGEKHRTKAQEASPVFIIDPTKDRCLHFEQIHSREHSERHHVNIAADLLAENEEIEIRNDLIDCGIDICTPDVLALWSDNFDFQAPRRGFLHSVLKDYELNGKTIHTHIVDNHYAARVRNLQAYDAVTQDVISRWAYPLCPDSNLMADQTYRYHKGNIYKEQGVILARSSVINRGTVIGMDTSIGEGSRISNSVIGRECQIGDNVTIEGAYIWDQAIIEDNAVIKKAIIADKAHVGRGCRVEPGALVSFGVRISNEMVVDSSSRLTTAKRKRLEGEEVERAPSDPKVVGQDGIGVEFVDEDDDEEDEVVEGLVPKRSIYSLAHLSVSNESISTLDSESDFTDEAMGHHDRSASGSFLSVASDASSHHASNFDHEAAESLLDSFRKGDDTANIQLELASLRMSTNASEHQVRRAVVTAVLRRISDVLQSGSVSVKQATDQVLSPHQTLLQRTMFDKNASSKADQVDFLLLMQADLSHRNEGDSILLHASMKLYDMDVIEDDAFEQWWADDKSSADEAMKKVRSKTQQFIDFLAQSDDESSEDEEEEDDDEDDDDE
ncbi:heat shock transcription factor 2, partial [Phyllosticta citricarpa]